MNWIIVYYETKDKMWKASLELEFKPTFSIEIHESALYFSKEAAARNILTYLEKIRKLPVEVEVIPYYA